MENVIFWVIVAIMLVDFIFERYLDWLNKKKHSNELPNELEGIYNEEEYKRSQDYTKSKEHFSQFTSTFSLVLILLMLFTGGFGFVDNLARSVSVHPILNALVFFGIIGIVVDVMTTPFELYSTFVIENRFGFNKTTPKTFVLDKFKGWLITAIIGGGLLSLIIWIHSMNANMFWIIAWVIITVFSLFMSMFYTSLILPLFNKQEPLQEGELRNNLETFSKKTGFKLDNIFVMDGSKRSTKANAFFSGLGPRKRIVLYDTLINDLEPDEVTAVLAHEIGHFKKKHTTQAMLISVASSGVMLFVLSLFLKSSSLSSALGASEPSFHINALAFGILYSPVTFILGIFMNILSRKNEYEADRFASKHFKAEPLIEGLKKLSVKSLSNLLPHKLYVFFNYSHPTLLQRINALRK